ncbi:MAG: hypothetical protein H0W50_08050 [Parachlamydiaceae bacterium]|nr:hypothetical protein [Parachlamydiaceae bacterium]
MENKRSEELSELDQLLQELIDGQQKTLLQLARRIVPNATSDDILQPNDFPELENHPHFRYEEGLLAGLQSAQIALRCH